VVFWKEKTHASNLSWEEKKRGGFPSFLSEKTELPSFAREKRKRGRKLLSSPSITSGKKKETARMMRK